jgi:hypothetical protein
MAMYDDLPIIAWSLAIKADDWVNHYSAVSTG